MNVFFDTNVLLDVLAQRQPFYPDSAAVWALAERGRVRGMVSAVSLTNLYYIVRKMSSGAAAMDMVRDIRAVATLVACDASVLNQAIDVQFTDFEDAVQYFSALAAGADCLVTRNTNHFPDSEIPILTPKEFLATHTFS